jgi:murein DD-endopeptidase MepM/ murein hydrolase activator NlpD
MDNGFQLYVDNNEYCPVSIEIRLKLDNLKSSDGNHNICVLPARTKHVRLSTLTRIQKDKKFKVNIKTNYNYGDHYLNDYDKDFEYCLPFQKGETYVLSQGYNGGLTHQNKNQLDFKMPVGKKVLAVRKGIVIKVVDEYDKHCVTQSCEKYNNYIYLYHGDGTIAEYVHIKKGSATVKVGELVKQGQTIAASGNVGWSTGPHLHFSVFLQRLKGQREYIETKFKLKDGIKTDYLAEGKNYTRAYD